MVIRTRPRERRPGDMTNLHAFRFLSTVPDEGLYWIGHNHSLESVTELQEHIRKTEETLAGLTLNTRDGQQYLDFRLDEHIPAIVQMSVQFERAPKIMAWTIFKLYPKGHMFHGKAIEQMASYGFRTRRQALAFAKRQQEFWEARYNTAPGEGDRFVVHEAPTWPSYLVNPNYTKKKFETWLVQTHR